MVHVQKLNSRGDMMLTFEIVNELTLKVTCKGNDMLYTKAGAFYCRGKIQAERIINLKKYY